MTYHEWKMALEDFLYGQSRKMPPLVQPNPPFKFPISKPVIKEKKS